MNSQRLFQLMRMAGMLTVVAGIALMAGGSAAAQVTGMEGEELLPPNAKPGECYARIFIPPTYKTETERVLRRDASERVEIVPARYETVTEKVLVKEASKRLEVIPATYDWVDERILVKPASERLVEVPAVYETVTEKVIEKPAHTVWKKGSGPIQKVDNATGEIMCLVEVPATYKTVTKKVLKTPATTRKVEIPAEYRVVRKRVMKTPPSTREVAIPAEHKMVTVTKMVKPAEERRVPVPAEYQVVTKTTQLTEGRMEWQEVLCQTNATPGLIMSVQRALDRAGHDPGDIDGILGQRTMEAVRSFQRAKGLPTGQLTMETIDALGVKMGT